MTAQEVIATIRAEIERLKSLAEQMDYQKKVGFNWALDDILSFLSSLESEKPMEILEKEIQKYLESKGVGYGGWIDGWKDEDLREIARHFYELGCARTAEKYDEIEYNRQKEEESVCNELEEEIEKYREEHEFSIPAFQQVARYFAQWGAEHLKQ